MALGVLIVSPVVSQTWPTSWIEFDWDKNENGSIDDWRDVQYAYYQYDNNYLYLKFKCYDLPGKGWPDQNGRYKWFIDLEGNLYYSGENIFEAEYLVFVEDQDHNSVGEMYLLYDANNDGNFNEYEPWPPANSANYRITDSNVGGYRIVAVNQIEMYIGWAHIGNPSSYWLGWATDQQNPNLDQGPTTDHVDEEKPIAVHDVAAVSQTTNATAVTQGDHVTVEVDVENQGTQTESFDVTVYFDSGTVGTKHVASLAAGQSTTLSFDWDTSGVPTGTYVLKAWTDSGAAITEIDETDNWCTVPATIAIEPPPVHDVAASSQIPNQTNVQQGAVVDIDVTVENLGDYAETFEVTCYYDNVQIGTKTVTNLLATQSTVLTFSWSTAGVASGVYYIKAEADSTHAIVEVDETNNNCTSLATVTVYVLGEQGELVVDKALTAVISGPNPPVAGFKTVYELTTTVINPGGGNVVDIVVEDTISLDVTFESVGTPSNGSVTATPPPKIVWNVGALTPGASATLTFKVSVTPTASGTLYLNHANDLYANGTDTYTSQEISDYGDTDVTVTAIVRDVRAFSQTPSSSTVTQGETISIDVTVQNLGDQTESFDVTCYYDNTPIGTLRAYSLPPSDSETLRFHWDTTGVAPGTYDIKAIADSGGEINESYETNNECKNLASVRIVMHDIATLSQTPSPMSVAQGETVTVQVVVENQGTEPETFTVALRYDNTQVGTPKAVNNLQPGTSQTLTFYWNTTGVSPGTYYMSAVASTVPSETDTNDNSCTSTTIVTVNSPAPPSPVGGVWVPINKTALLAPWIRFALLIIEVVISMIYVKNRKKHKS